MNVLFSSAGRSFRHHQQSLRRLLSTRSPYPVVQTCPAPTCDCRPMPSELDIDHKRPLDGTVARYAEHMLIHTGASDWPSRVEDDERVPLAKELRYMMIPGSKYFSPEHRVLITASSFARAGHAESGATSVSFPRIGKHVVLGKAQSREAFVARYLLPSTPRVDGAPREEFVESTVPQVTVMICGHGGRDVRCGVMGPLLEAEFREKLARAGFSTPQDTTGSADHEHPKQARVGLISHIGGHAFAGNVIIYVPRTEQFVDHPLAGVGVWYGRVEPRHVEGIIKETVVGGTLIQELLRGTV